VERFKAVEPKVRKFLEMGATLRGLKHAATINKDVKCALGFTNFKKVVITVALEGFCLGPVAKNIFDKRVSRRESFH
jgi:hypothetical protein